MENELNRTVHSISPVENYKRRLRALVEELREHIERVEDDQTKALFETTAETLQGLENAFQHYQEESETAWR